MSVVDAESLITDALGRLPAASTDGELVAEVETIGRLQNLLDARRLQLLPEADARGVCRRVGYTKMKAWVADTAGVTTTEAAGWLRLARQLQTIEYEPINHALAAGGMSGGHARQIVKRLTTLPVDVDADTRVKVRDHLIHQARWLDPKALGHQAETVLEVEAPEILQREHEHQAGRHELHAGRRELTILRNADGDGMARIYGWLPGPDADVIVESLHRIAYPANTTSTANTNTDENEAGELVADDRTPGQRMCDALCEYFTGDRSHTAADTPGASSKPRLMITIGLDQLQSGPGTGYLDQSGQPLPVETIRQAACDAGIIPAVLNSTGLPLDLGREQRLVTAKLRQALELRDRGCIFPGCRAPLSRVDAHHVTPWEHGGRTDIDNTVLLCRRHHTFIHHSRWTIRIGTDRHPELVPPAADGVPTTPMRQHRRRARSRPRDTPRRGRMPKRTNGRT